MCVALILLFFAIFSHFGLSFVLPKVSAVACCSAPFIVEMKLGLYVCTYIVYWFVSVCAETSGHDVYVEYICVAEGSKEHNIVVLEQREASSSTRQIVRANAIIMLCLACRKCNGELSSQLAEAMHRERTPVHPAPICYERKRES